MEKEEKKDTIYWFVMRDLKRSNAKQPAYKLLSEADFETFTPMKWILAQEKGKKVRKEVPVIKDLLFVHTERALLDPIVEKNDTLQYRYLKGGGYREAMTVKEAEMQRFIQAVQATDNPRYYLPEEITPAMYGKEIRITDGPLAKCTGRLMTMRGSKVKRLLVELPNLLTVAVTVEQQYIQLI
jgi:transcription antitermination factor NusG